LCSLDWPCALASRRPARGLTSDWRSFSARHRLPVERLPASRRRALPCPLSRERHDAAGGGRGPASHGPRGAAKLPAPRSSAVPGRPRLVPGCVAPSPAWSPPGATGCAPCPARCVARDPRPLGRGLARASQRVDFSGPAGPTSSTAPRAAAERPSPRRGTGCTRRLRSHRRSSTATPASPVHAFLAGARGSERGLHPPTRSLP
jgi:hypothetical protein